MGQRPFKELPRSKQYAVLYRDTKRLRHMVEADIGSEITDEEWLRILPHIVGETVKRIRVKRQPTLQQRLEDLAANSRY